MASGGSGIDVRGGGASAKKSSGSGDGKSSGGENSACGGETDKESRISIVAIQLCRTRINYRPSCSAVRCKCDVQTFW
jgi:hypothetical protein